MRIDGADVAALGSLLAAQGLMLLTPGANQLALCCASAVSLRRGLHGAGVLAGIVALLASVAAVFGRTLADEDRLLQHWLGAGAAYIAFLGARRLLSAVRGVSSGAAEGNDGWQVALTALSNPFSLVFYMSVVVPVTASHDEAGFSALVVIAMTGLAALVYAALAVAFSCPPVRRTMGAHRRTTDALIGLCLVGLAVRLSTGLLPV